MTRTFVQLCNPALHARLELEEQLREPGRGRPFPVPTKRERDFEFASSIDTQVRLGPAPVRRRPERRD
jgi:hypothetical protein